MNRVDVHCKDSRSVNWECVLPRVLPRVAQSVSGFTGPARACLLSIPSSPPASSPTRSPHWLSESAAGPHPDDHGPGRCLSGPPGISGVLLRHHTDGDHSSVHASVHEPTLPEAPRAGLPDSSRPPDSRPELPGHVPNAVPDVRSYVRSYVRPYLVTSSRATRTTLLRARVLRATQELLLQLLHHSGNGGGRGT